MRRLVTLLLVLWAGVAQASSATKAANSGARALRHAERRARRRMRVTVRLSSNATQRGGLTAL